MSIFNVVWTQAYFLQTLLYIWMFFRQTQWQFALRSTSVRCCVDCIGSKGCLCGNFREHKIHVQNDGAYNVWIHHDQQWLKTDVTITTFKFRRPFLNLCLLRWFYCEKHIFSNGACKGGWCTHPWFRFSVGWTLCVWGVVSTFMKYVYSRVSE